MTFSYYGYSIVDVRTLILKEKNMKYYYKDILVRTSKTHEYHFAVIKELDDGIAVLACSKTYEGAMASRRQLISYTINDLEVCEKLQEARRNGKSGFFAKGQGRKETYRKTSDYDDKWFENLEERIDYNKQSIDEFNRTVKVVEIEAR